MATKTSSIRYYELADFEFNDGTNLPRLKVAYQILNPEKSKIAVVHTCFRGRIKTTLAHADGALRGYKIILVALLGNGESSSPSNTIGFPKTLDYKDCVKAQHQLLTQELQIDAVDVMLGFSMGGQITYHWITTHPQFVKAAVIVCSSAKTSEHNIQFLEGPRAALENAADAKRGVCAFGKAYSAWLTSAEWFDQQLYKEMGFDTLLAWDKVATDSGYDDWSGEDLLIMLGMWQRGDITHCVPAAKDDLSQALEAIQAQVLLMPCETDQYFRPYVNKREAKSLKRAEVAVVPSIWGHIAGGGANPKDVEWMKKKIEAFLQG
ncbi:Alpha/Beta hydrolase protein [Phaeosphaeria sp. MPI-PUGE-AT-0046c]|nr:Alpha/Beta hydrolase protein [Phaeosphaeria sp. MPI-PUGE-AT-0046c]